MSLSKERKLENYYTRKAKFILLLGGKCVECGSIEDLEFDHIDSTDKLFNVTSLLAHTEEKILSELSKCQLLCKVCHKRKTRAQRIRLVHGTLGAYRHHRCRCEKCRAVWNAKTKEYKLQSRLMVGQRSLKP